MVNAMHAHTLSASTGFRFLCGFLSLTLVLLGMGLPTGALAQEKSPPAAGAAPGKELVAIMDLLMIDGSGAQGAALTNQLRAEVLKTGKVTLIDRSQMTAVLDEQALQQSGCTSQECAVDVGRILGIRKIVTGTITKLGDSLWQVSVQMVDVETAETVRADTFNHVGVFQDLLIKGMSNVALLLFPDDTKPPQQIVEETRPAAPPPAPAAVKSDEGGGVPWWMWVLGAVGVAALVVAASGGGGGGGGGSTPAGDGGSADDDNPSSGGPTGSVGFSY